ncbi:hypothetical protein RBWH47_00577 [Rhodopirellula baltica WH47]|uniref:Uncharacterized protein n=2 Tax=Rhodopirellula baltica TaxID=265606 RepID=F2ALD2_RHOBT|nr:hypothetical protein RBWH47_00577 [Rhodopirellula baltica WH47]
MSLSKEVGGMNQQGNQKGDSNAGIHPTTCHHLSLATTQCPRGGSFDSWYVSVLMFGR